MKYFNTSYGLTKKRERRKGKGETIMTIPWEGFWRMSEENDKGMCMWMWMSMYRPVHDYLSIYGISGSQGFWWDVLFELIVLCPGGNCIVRSRMQQQLFIDKSRLVAGGWWLVVGDCWWLVVGGWCKRKEGNSKRQGWELDKEDEIHKSWFDLSKWYHLHNLLIAAVWIFTLPCLCLYLLPLPFPLPLPLPLPFALPFLA